MSMNDAEMAKAGFLRQRRAGIGAITAAMPVALLLLASNRLSGAAAGGHGQPRRQDALYAEMLLSRSSVLPRHGRGGRGA